ncbi:MAG: DUF411 domain-containing protein [Candidatus Reddybacter sp.]
MNYKHCLVGALLTINLVACSEKNEEPTILETSVVASVEVGQQSEAEQPSPAIAMDLYKSPTCGCCGKWADHAEDRGFALTTHHPADLSKLKAERGIAPQYRSCHTVVSADDYVFEGHVPARFIHQFLTAPPADAIGLAVPAMPMGSPGMEMGDRFSPYQVLLLKRDGSAEVYAEVSSPLEQY